MDELARKLASIGSSVVPSWTEARAERLLTGVSRLRVRRRKQRIAVAAATLFLCVGGVTEWTRAPHNTRLVGTAPGLKEPGMAPRSVVVPPEVIQRGDKPLPLADGSKVYALSRQAAVRLERNLPGRIGLALDSGGARFDVIPNPSREFLVHAGQLEVSVLGTIFDVEHEADRVRVSVTRGKVRVRSAKDAAQQTLLLAGDSALFDAGGHELEAEALDPANPSESGEAELASASERASAEPHNRGRAVSRVAASRRAQLAARAANAANNGSGQRAAWRSLSQSGDYEGAYQLLVQEKVVENDSGALLDAADAARLSGHPEAAVRYLRRVIDEHRDTPVAPLAAFTLGRVLLERLGQPSEAAEAFATVRRLAPSGSLAQDALAREVEAWSKAGYPDEAYRRAREYVESYPHGRRLRSVQLYGGL